MKHCYEEELDIKDDVADLLEQVLQYAIKLGLSIRNGETPVEE